LTRKQNAKLLAFNWATILLTTTTIRQTFLKNVSLQLAFSIRRAANKTFIGITTLALQTIKTTAISQSARAMVLMNGRC
jgi:hypothetical protein